jgi:hypothetical protein
MTKKDYVLIAEMIEGQLSNLPQLPTKDTAAAALSQLYGFRVAVQGIVKALKVDNPNFDSVRFLQACGVEA